MKYLLLTLIAICGLPLAGTAQSQRICKDRAVPSGYRIVGEMIAPECGKTGWIIRKVGARTSAGLSDETLEGELGEGVLDAEKKTIRRLRAAGREAVNVPVLLSGSIQVSEYYYGSYAQADKTHSAFEVKDATGSVFVYAPRNETNQLRQKIALQKGRARGLFTVVLPAETIDGGEVLGDLIGYRLEPPAPADKAPAVGSLRSKN